MLIHVRYSEIGLKGGRRSWFERRLRDNLSLLTGVPPERVQRIRGRVTIRLRDEDPAEVLAGVQRTFGVVSASLVAELPKEVEAIRARAVEEARRLHEEHGYRTFKVETRRADKTFPVGSYQLSASLGEAILEAVPGLRVDVHHPELTIHLEVRDEGAYLYSAAVAGPGGIPSGIAGRALCMLSGGIDSPVAAWYALKRGLAVDSVYFHAFPYTGEKVQEKVLTLARLLSRWTPGPSRVFVLSTTRIQDAIAEVAPEPLRIVLLRRAMYRLAGAVLRAEGHAALVTGESLGQVASQTPENLRCVEDVVPDLLVLRPLVGFDKQEIIVRARAIETYETSVLPFQDCCSLFAPRSPAVAATPEQCREVEARLPLAELEATSLSGREVHRFQAARALEPSPPAA